MTPARILVLCTRRLGDVLLSTALVRSLRVGYPDAAIDVLTLAGSAAALRGNPDIRRVLTLPAGAGLRDSLRAIGGWRRYDLAVSTLVDDRPQLMALCAAPRRANIVPRVGKRGAWWKRRVATVHVDAQVPWIHMVEQYLRLADALGLARQQPVAPRPQTVEPLDRLLGAGWRERAYAVLHPVPLYAYKAWTLEGWAALVQGLAQRGLRSVLTAGPAEAEKAFVRELAARSAAHGVHDLSGQLEFAQLTPLIEGARLFVGPDTSVTHLAAATGTPTIALFGPSPPVNWAPWPQGYAETGAGPWVLQAPLQQRHNVWVVQGVAHCVPCQREGCERNPGSRSLCLDELPAARVLAAADQALRQRG